MEYILPILVLASVPALIVAWYLSSKISDLREEFEYFRHAYYTEKKQSKAESQKSENTLPLKRADTPPPVHFSETEILPRESEKKITETPPVCAFQNLDEVNAPESSNKSNPFEKGLASQAFIWVGGLALIFAGFFLVKYSIEQGLITPKMRVVSAFCFSGVLGIFAEIFRRRNKEHNIPCSLMGAAMAVAYGAFYAASQFYGLIPPMAGIAGFVAVSAFGLFLAKLFGWQMSLLAVFGAFIAPLVISTGNASSPVLLSYLLVMTFGMLGVFYKQRNAKMALALIVSNAFWALIWLAIFFKSRDALLPYHLWLILESLGFAAFGFMARKKTLAGEDFAFGQEHIFRYFAHSTIFVSYLLVSATLLVSQSMGGEYSLLSSSIPFYVFGAIYFLAAFADKEFRYTLWVSSVACAAVTYNLFAMNMMFSGCIVFGIWMLSSGFVVFTRKQSAGFAACFGLAAFFFTWPFIENNLNYAHLAVIFAAAALPLMLACFNGLKYEILAKKWLVFFSTLTFALFCIHTAFLEKPAASALVLAFVGLSLIRLDSTLMRMPVILLGVLALFIYGFCGAFKYMYLALFCRKEFIADYMGAFNVVLLALVCVVFAVLLQKFRPKTSLCEFIWSASLFAVLLLAVFASAQAHTNIGHFSYLSSAFVGLSSMLGALLMLFVFTKFKRETAVYFAFLVLFFGFARFTFVACTKENPFDTAIWVAGIPFFNAFAVSMLLPGIVLFLAAKFAYAFNSVIPYIKNAFYTAAVLMMFAWVNSQVAFCFKGNILIETTGLAEFYTYSAAWLVWSLLLLAIGYVRENKVLRICSLLFASATAIKVFLFDTSELDGLWRALSFAMLGFCLIGIGWFYMRFVFKDSTEAQ